MQRDHRLGFPAALLADTPAANTARYPLGRPKRDLEPQTWPFPLIKPAMTFVEDSRTPGSDKPQPVVLCVDMGSHEGDQFILMRNGSAITFVSGGPVANVAPGCFGVWRKTPPQPNVELQFRSPWTGEIKSKWPGPQSGWADGWEWFDTAAEPEKPAKAEPQADADGWIEHKPGPRPAHLKAGMKVELKWNSAINDTNVCVLQDPFGNGWEDGIVAYRVVSA